MPMTRNQIAQRYRLFLCRILEVEESELDVEPWDRIIYDFALKSSRLHLYPPGGADSAILHDIATHWDEV